ncbi:hypothetical protein MGF_3987 [Mycoplasmoides gallisepticum str. F]|nr:hypothetical protein MGF_3987 [Mycoplasmoides gallisepticum str. F]
MLLFWLYSTLNCFKAFTKALISFVKSMFCSVANWVSFALMLSSLFSWFILVSLNSFNALFTKFIKFANAWGCPWSFPPSSWVWSQPWSWSCTWWLVLGCTIILLSKTESIQELQEKPFDIIQYFVKKKDFKLLKIYFLFFCFFKYFFKILSTYFNYLISIIKTKIMNRTPSKVLELFNYFQR